jgi:hypothetical protein
MGVIMLRPRLLLVVLLALAGTARADGFLERLRKESAIERKMVLAEVRGQLHLYKKPAPPDWSARTWKKGKLEVQDGVPILRLEGTPAEMAEQHAHLLGKEARALAESYLPAFVGGKKELERARARARELFWPHLTDSEKDEIRVFARESGIDEKDVLLSQCFPDLYRSWGCSTLAAVGDGSAEGPLLARNLDFVSMGFIQDYSLVVVARPAGKKPYVSVAWPGILGVLSAQNDSVALSVMVVHDGGCEPGVPFELAFRRAIESASSTDDVTKTLEATKMTVANNLMVVDKAGSARLLEIAPGGKIVARKPDAKGHLASTNHFCSSELRESRASLTYLSSVRRLQAVERTCAKDEKVTIDTAIAALRASAPARINVQSMIFEPSKGALRVALGKPPAAEHRFVRLGREVLLGEESRA